jgi:hypothetical protein
VYSYSYAKPATQVTFKRYYKVGLRNNLTRYNSGDYISMKHLEQLIIDKKQSCVLGLASLILAGIGIVSLSMAPAFAASTSINTNAGANAEAQQGVEDAKAEAEEAAETAEENMNEAAEEAEENVEAAQENVKNAEEDAAASMEADAEVNTTSI